MQRTNATMTAGIVNIPLTKPAKLFFTTQDTIELANIALVLERNGIEFAEHTTGQTFHIESTKELTADIIKRIYFNHKNLKPHIQTDWRYLFWETDTRDNETLVYVKDVYVELGLPVYIHESMRGYHFISVKPIEKAIWKTAVEKLRKTNLDFPPITLRVLANKWVNEKEAFKVGVIIAKAYHADTERIMTAIEQQNIAYLERHYMTVWYPIDIKRAESHA